MTQAPQKVLTEREIFDKVQEHLLTQNAQSMMMTDSGEVCAYRGQNGLSCAVGCLIKDEYYDPKGELHNAMHRPNREALAASGVVPLGMSHFEVQVSKTFSLLSLLQRIHDNFDPKDWAEKLSSLERHWFKEETQNAKD